jgi:cell division septum initiation protein DivIVA
VDAVASRLMGLQQTVDDLHDAVERLDKRVSSKGGLHSPCVPLSSSRHFSRRGSLDSLSIQPQYTENNPLKRAASDGGGADRGDGQHFELEAQLGELQEQMEARDVIARSKHAAMEEELIETRAMLGQLRAEQKYMLAAVEALKQGGLGSGQTLKSTA